MGFYLTWNGYLRKVEALIIAEFYRYLKFNEIIDVSASASYDLMSRQGDEEIHIEVKGTTTEGKSILLTKNEVKHAKDFYPKNALIVVSNITLVKDENGKINAEGGNTEIFQPWKLEQEYLVPLSYKYTIPEKIE